MNHLRQFEFVMRLPGIPNGPDIHVTYRYTPNRPAPHCHNHDSPAFSDMGDAPELEIVEVIFKGDTFDLMPIISDSVQQEIKTAAFQDAEKRELCAL